MEGHEKPLLRSALFFERKDGALQGVVQPLYVQGRAIIPKEYARNLLQETAVQAWEAHEARMKKELEGAERTLYRASLAHLEAVRLLQTARETVASLTPGVRS